MTDNQLSMLIADIERRMPNPDGTFAEILDALRELQRLRANIDDVNSYSNEWADDDFCRGFDACVKIINRDAAERGK